MISCLFYDKISFYLVADASPKVVLASQPLNVLHADGFSVQLTVSHPLEAVEDHTSIESLGKTVLIRDKGSLVQIASAGEWYHWIGLEKDINRCRFFIFYF